MANLCFEREVFLNAPLHTNAQNAPKIYREGLDTFGITTIGSTEKSIAAIKRECNELAWGRDYGFGTGDWSRPANWVSGAADAIQVQRIVKNDGKRANCQAFAYSLALFLRCPHPAMVHVGSPVYPEDEDDRACRGEDHPEGRGAQPQTETMGQEVVAG